VPRLIRLGAWGGTAALVVLAARTLAYALVPQPTLRSVELEQAAGGPRLVLVAVGALGTAAALAVAILALAALAVRERLTLESARVLSPPRLRPLRLLCRFLALGLVSSLAFALLESYLHWRAGLGWHGLSCVVGPVHRDAIPLVAGLALVAVALFASVEHLGDWARRTFARLVGVPRLRRPTRARPEPQMGPPTGARVGGALPARAPPRPLLPPRAATAAIRSERKEMDGMNSMIAGRRLVAVLLSAGAALVVVASASAHAQVSPPVALSSAGQVFTLAVPTEKEDLTTTKVELTLPAGFSIDSFAPSAGWKRSLEQTGSGEEAVIQKVTWDGGSVPTEEDALFQFLGRADSSKTYTFDVRQTYSDGSVVDWTGPESSDTPAPTLEAKSSFGGGGISILSIVALVLGALGLLVGTVALLAHPGGRALA
jgi:uncharacterized protein YcnI